MKYFPLCVGLLGLLVLVNAFAQPTFTGECRSTLTGKIEPCNSTYPASTNGTITINSVGKSAINVNPEDYDKVIITKKPKGCKVVVLADTDENLILACYKEFK